MIEYVVLILFLLAAFLVMQKYITRSISGRWKSVGDSLGAERIYDPHRTAECAYDIWYDSGWYNAICFEKNCECYGFKATAATCRDCITGCHVPVCDD